MERTRYFPTCDPQSKVVKGVPPRYIKQEISRKERERRERD